ncbi:P-loop containing nucleoside triphosphate hydrolase protein [Mycena metata]|uniref:DNA 3'-5' helicase n=1 Tax=Mycena metata TaxID=1033252 RepID=A0AAD7I9U3_9AGAR|nr:P-loop containing nucleoside triphosphate hydrolase protein [Mycena metata]
MSASPRAPPKFVWSSPEGYALVRRILKSTPVPYDPHDYQLEGICKSLDGVNLFAITPTGSGKTSYYIIYILVVLAVVADPTLCPTATFPTNPCLLVICPTIPLQMEMALGLDPLAINSQTRDEARRERNEDLWMLARTKPNVILTGPEQLKSADFEKALRDDEFYNRICGTGFDEVHLLNSWGASFRKDFGQMGFVKARLPEKHNPWMLGSATVRIGRPFDSICQLLGLRDGNYHLIRRSCARPDVQILFRDLISPISGDSFPELDFILTENRPTVIFPKTISLASRIYTYLLRTEAAKHPNQRLPRPNRIRMYNSLNFDSYNAETRELLKRDADDDDYCQVVIGTDSLSVGVAMGARMDAVLIGTIDDTDDLLQKLGRVNRTKLAGAIARGIVYVSAATRKLSQKAVDREETGVSKAGEVLPDISIARLTLAGCKVAEVDKLYDNPDSDAPCACAKCSALPPASRPAACNCENLPPIKAPARRAKAKAKPSTRLSKIQRAHGVSRLLDLRIEIWKAADQSRFWMFPPLVFLSDALITSILDNFFVLDTLEKVRTFVKPHQHIRHYAPRLFALLQKLIPEFTRIAADRKAENAAKLKAKKAAEALVAATEATDQSENSEGDSEDNSNEDVPMEDVELRYV